MSHRTLNRAGFILWQFSACFLQGNTNKRKKARKKERRKERRRRRLRVQSCQWQIELWQAITSTGAHQRTLNEKGNKSVLSRLVSNEQRNLREGREQAQAHSWVIYLSKAPEGRHKAHRSSPVVFFFLLLSSTSLLRDYHFNHLRVGQKSSANILPSIVSKLIQRPNVQHWLKTIRNKSAQNFYSEFLQVSSFQYKAGMTLYGATFSAGASFTSGPALCINTTGSKTRQQIVSMWHHL